MRVWSVLLVLGACSDDHPDTGYGEATPVPAQIECMTACVRLADCVVQLCDEDKDSTKYNAFEQDIADNCLSSCDDDSLQAFTSPDEWSCMFGETCRSVFEHDTCGIKATYTCK
jgi:predicted metal-binding protein